MTKIMTLNTHSWMEENPEQKLADLVTQIVKADYELIALQEVNQLLASKSVVPDKYFQALTKQMAIHEDNFALVLVEKLKAAGLNYYWSWEASHIGYDRYAEGSAILSKHEIVAESFFVSAESDFSDYHTRKILLAHTQLMGEDVRVLSGHYSWWESDSSGFAYEWDQTLAHLKQVDTPIILMGDLNNAADVSGEGYDYVQQTAPQLLDAYQQADVLQGRYTVEKSIDGWEGNQQKLRIDYIFVSDDFKVARYQVIFDNVSSPIVSDHYGIEVELFN